jgi:hypothetical protein
MKSLGIVGVLLGKQASVSVVLCFPHVSANEHSSESFTQ